MNKQIIERVGRALLSMQRYPWEQGVAAQAFLVLGDGWLNAAYRPAADRMRAAAHARVDPDGWVRDVCGAPTFDDPGIAAEGQAFFLLMEAAFARLTPG